MSCLVIKNDGIGDLILCSGVLKSLAENYGGQIDLVTCEENRPIVELMSFVGRAYYLSRDSLKIASDSGQVKILPD
ncbi:MAG: hypothetical protein AAF202_13565, partial [Pseudomonadota bacterium]